MSKKKRKRKVQITDDEEIGIKKKVNLQRKEENVKQKFVEQIKTINTPYIYYKCRKCKFFTKQKIKAMAHASQCTVQYRRKVMSLPCQDSPPAPGRRFYRSLTK